MKNCRLDQNILIVYSNRSNNWQLLTSHIIIIINNDIYNYFSNYGKSYHSILVNHIKCNQTLLNYARVYGWATRITKQL